MGRRSAFQQERTGFRKFRQGFSKVRQDMENAIRELFVRYDTRIRENRFVVGGAIEIIIGAAMRTCGVEVYHRGTETVVFDLVFPGKSGGYSVKSMLKSTSTRLINVLGRPPALSDWKTATLFLVPSGIVYADPGLQWWKENTPHAVRIRSDALEIRRSCVENFANSHPAWKIDCRLDVRLNADERTRVRTASYDLALSVLKDIGGELFSSLPPLLE